ncbi:MAG: hypothetical protein K2N56_08765 [Oscillospiraceae bacterium]|nr:hypothetical protein [Oscillospiraceae bacterium]
MKNILKNAKCCSKIAAQNILSWAQNYRMIMLLLLLGATVAQYCAELEPYSDKVRAEINGLAVLPVMYNSYISYFRVVIQLGIVLMFSNAPFKNADSMFCVMRTGYARWCAGELLYIVSASFIYTVSLFVMTNIFCVNKLTYSLKWGRTFTAMQDGTFGYGVHSKVLLQYKPLEALLHTMLFIFLLSVLFGLLIFLMSSLVGRSSGVFIASALVLLGLMPNFTQRPALIAKLSPCSLTEISMTDKLGISYYPSLAYAYTVLCVLIVILFSANIIIYSNRKIRQNIYAAEV